MSGIIRRITGAETTRRRRAPGDRPRLAPRRFTLCVLTAFLLAYAPNALADCPVFGPKVYTRTFTVSDVFNETFNLTNLSGTFTLVINNGDASGQHRVRSGKVSLNGVEVLNNKVFNDQAGLIQKVVTVQASNSMTITLSGNAAASPFITLKVVRHIAETNGPTITINQPQPNQVFASSPTTVSGTVTDQSDITTFTINGASAPLTGGAFSAQVALNPGTNTVTLAAADCEGNTSTRSVAVVYDALPPVVNITSPPDNFLTRVPEVQVLGTASDDGAVSGVTVNGQPATLSGGAFSASITLVEGHNPISVVATDTTGKQTTAQVSAALDTTPPTLSIDSPSPGTSVNADTVNVTGQVSDASGLDQVVVNDSPAAIVNGRFQHAVGLKFGGNLVVVIAKDRAGNTKSVSLTVDRISVVVLEVGITAPAPQTLYKEGGITVTGTVDQAATAVEVNGVQATLGGGAFTAVNVPLKEGANVLTATASNDNNGTGAASVSVVLDSTPPTVRIDTPTEGAVLTSSSVSVTGMVNDVVSGTVNAEQATITVNGVPTEIANRTFTVPELLLVRGSNVLTAVARDRAGNESRHEVRVTVQDADGHQRVVVVSGNNQSGVIGATLPEPLVVQLLDTDGNPMGQQHVTFTVRRSDGILQALPQEGQEISVQTDANGRASASFKLGTRAGVGNNTVEVTARGFTGQAMFSASASAGAPARMTSAMVMGESQTGIVGKPLPMPFEVIVFDAGGNPVAGVPVVFRVEQGGGSLGGQATVTKNTDGDGKASVPLTLGLQEGLVNNVLSATFSPPGGGSEQSLDRRVVFTATGLAQGAPADTFVSGVVLDNQHRPIPHAHAKIVGTELQAYTNEQGRFSISNAPVGTVTLIVDAATTTRPEQFPFLAFQMMTIAGKDNTVGMPIFIPFLDAENAKTVGGAEDVVLTMKGVPGVAFTVFANSVTKPDGTKYVGPMTLTQVHADKVPMPPPNGGAPKVVWTLQPAGLHFNRPIQVQLPNTDGLTPGQVIEIFSFDHALEQFVSGGMARVSPDGSVIVSDPGFGVYVSGWGAPQPPPPPKTCVNGCNTDNKCMTGRCVDGVCQYVPANEGNRCDDGSGCSVGLCNGGVCWTQTKKDLGTQCDDGDMCTTSSICNDAGRCVGITRLNCGENQDTDPCKDPYCDPSSGCQVRNTDGNGCDDGDVCTKNEVCRGGACSPGTVECDDQKSCTADSCDASGNCTHTPTREGERCNDGGMCGTCQSGECKGVDQTTTWVQDASFNADTTMPPQVVDAISNAFRYIPGLGGVQLNEVRLGVQGRARDCCDPTTGEAKTLGHKEVSGTAVLTVEVENIPIWGPPRIFIERDFGPVAIGIYFNVGVRLDIRARINGQFGRTHDTCNAADNCVFGEANFSSDFEPKIAIQAEACTITDYTGPDCVGLNITPISFRISLRAGARFNRPDCGRGLEPFVSIGRFVFRAEFRLNLLLSQPRVVYEYVIFEGFQSSGTP